MTWGEDFPGWDDPANSKVSGLMQPAPLPANAAQRPPEEAGFEEIPDLGHQGGSTYCLSKYSKSADAAWVFLQWATSSNTQTRASIIGGGASPMRQSTFDDPRVKAEEVVGAGTTRHFPAMLEVITDPDGDRAAPAAVAVDRDRHHRRRARQADHRRLRVDQGRRRRDGQKVNEAAAG